MTTKEFDLELTDGDIQVLAVGVTSTRPVEIGCDDCLDQVASYAESRLQGLPTSAALRLVEEHLELCPDCREEFESLAQALRDLQTGGTE